MDSWARLIKTFSMYRTCAMQHKGWNNKSLSFLFNLMHTGNFTQEYYKFITYIQMVENNGHYFLKQCNVIGM